MNSALINALSALYRAGAKAIPNPEEVVNAHNGKKWFGEKKDGSHWMLVKHGIKSYNVTC